MTQLMECKRTIVSNHSEIERSVDITDFPLEYRECIDFTSQLNRNFIVIDFLKCKIMVKLCEILD